MALWLSASLPAATRAQDMPLPTPPATATPAQPIPLPEIAKRSDELVVYLQEVERRADPGEQVQEIEADLPTLLERINALRDRTTRVLPARPSLSLVDDLTDQWQSLQSQLNAWNDVLTVRATQLDQEMNGLAELQAVWRATRDMAASAGAPPAVLERIKSTLALIQAMRKQVDAYRQTLLVLQDRVVQESAICRDALAALRDYRRDAVGRLLVRDGLPIWAPERWSGTGASAVATLRDQASTAAGVLRDYLATQLPRLPLHLFLFIGLFFLWRAARRRTVRWLADDDSLANVAAVFEHPFSAALLLALLSSLWIYPQAPIQLRTLVRIAAVPALLRVIDRMVDAPLLPGMYILGTFFAVDQLRAVVVSLPAFEQLLFLLEMVAGVVALLWMLRSGRLRRLSGQRSPRIVMVVERGALVVAALFAFAALAAALGFMQLARVVAGAVLGSGYAAIMLFVLQRLAAGVWAFALRTPLMRRLRAVQRHRPLLEARGERYLTWIATTLWIVSTLRSAELLDPTVETISAVLGAHLAVGTFSVSLGNLLAFVVTIWLSVLVSRFVRFALEEDIYPRLHLQRGLPYAFSNVLHYTILLVGFLIGLAATGINLDRFTILAGAFGVGVGFGMQNIVNNFVSGLILLFERPIQIGDVVQIGDLLGEVRRIGIRASTVRTAEGAEVIVPNGNLISAPVTNWTLSDRMRRIDLNVGVPYGTDPERVLDLLRRVAAANPRIVEDPPPVGLFIGFTTTTLDFQLRAWTDRFEEWVVIRSELAVAVNRALTEAGFTPSAPSKDAKEEAPAPKPAESGSDGTHDA